MTIGEALAELLGVREGDHPATYFQLLGVSPEESDPVAIERAAYRQAMRLEAAPKGVSKGVLRHLDSLIAEARQCLTDPTCRQLYVEQLATGTTFDDTNVRHLAGTEWLPEVPPREPGDPDRREWTLGAGRDCDIVIDDPYVSRRHCRIVYEGGKYWVEDLGSANGTFHNSQPVVRRKEIFLDDAIGLGKTLRIKWSQYITEHHHAHEGEPRPALVHVARRTLKFCDSDSPLAQNECPAPPDAAPTGS